MGKSGGRLNPLKMPRQEDLEVAKVKNEGEKRLKNIEGLNAQIGIIKNPLQTPLNSLGDKFAVTLGLLLKASNDISRYNKIVAEGFKNRSGEELRFVSGQRLVVTDWTGPTDNGWNIYAPTAHQHLITTDSLDEYTDSLTRRLSMWSVAISFDAMETFVKELFAVFVFMQRTEILPEVLKEFGGPNRSDKGYLEYIRSKSSLGRNSAQPIIESFVRLSQSFKDFENNNNMNMSLRWWFHSLSLIRHAIAHGTFQVEKKLVNVPKKGKKRLIRWYQEEYGLLMEGDVYRVSFSNRDASGIIQRMFAFAYTLFKATSIDCGHEWDIYKKIK